MRSTVLSTGKSQGTEPALLEAVYSELIDHRLTSAVILGNAHIPVIVVANALRNEEMSALIRLCMNRSSLFSVSSRAVASNSRNSVISR